MSRIPRRRGVATAFCLLALSLVAGCGGSGKAAVADPQQKPVAGSSGAPISLNFQPAALNMTFLSLLHALDAGYFKQEGLDLKVLPLVSDATIVAQSLVSGQADIAGNSTTALLAVRAAHRDIVSVAVSGRSPVAVLALTKKALAKLSGVTATSDPTQKIKALKGMTLGLPAPNSASELLLRNSLKSAGLNPDKDLTLRNITGNGPAGLVAAARQGQVDGYVIGLPEAVQGVSEGWAVTWLNYVSGEDPANRGLPYNDILTSRAYAEKNPEAIRRFVKAMWHSLDDLKTNPASAKAGIKAKFFPDLDPQLYSIAFDTALPAFTQTLLPDETSFKNILKIYNTTRDNPVDLKFQDVYLSSFAEATRP